MKIYRYIPTFIEIDELRNNVEEFETTTELINIPWVKIWEQHSEFYQFSKSGEMLIAETANGFSWWVVGRFSDPDKVDLPRWEPPIEALKAKGIK